SCQAKELRKNKTILNSNNTVFPLSKVIPNSRAVQHSWVTPNTREAQGRAIRPVRVARQQNDPKQLGDPRYQGGSGQNDPPRQGGRGEHQGGSAQQNDPKQQADPTHSGAPAQQSDPR